MTHTSHLVDEDAARRFLDGERIAVVGASGEKGNFGAVLARALRQNGTAVVTIHPQRSPVDDLPAYAALDEVPGSLDGALLMVPADAAVEVVRTCIAIGVPRIWFFRGIGSAGAVSEMAIAEATAAGIEVVPGACPLMFLEPVSWFHRVHRSARRHRGVLVA